MITIILSCLCIIALTWASGRIMATLGLPDLLGMIILGIVLGPHMKDALFGDSTLGNFISLPHEVMEFSSPARVFALIVILLRAGLGIDRSTLRHIGWPAARMGSLPCLIEGFTITLVAPHLVPITYIESMCLGFVIAAVSPAVIVPAMLDLTSQGLGKKNEVPTLILAGASMDDVFAITVFGAAISALGNGGDLSVSSMLISIPLQIGIGIATGIATAWILQLVFRIVKPPTLIIVATCLLSAGGLYWLEKQHLFPMASLLGIMAMGFYLNEHSLYAPQLSKILTTIWSPAKLLLFFFIGAEVDALQAANAGGVAIAVIIIGLCGRWVGVWISLLGTKLNTKERLFCLLANIPKATVQAAIGATALTMVRTGSITLSQGDTTGGLILSFAVLSILITAPIGAIAVAKLGPKLLQ